MAHQALPRMTTVLFFALSAAFTAAPVAGLAETNPEPGAIGIAYVSGEVGVQRGDDPDIEAAERNAPLLPGDSLSTAGDGRAEIRLDRAARLRLDTQTSVRVVSVGSGTTELDLGAGTVEVRIFRAGTTAQIDLPSAAFVASEPGRYVVSVKSDGTALVTTYAGRATLSGPSLSDPVPAGSSDVVGGTANAPSFENKDAVAAEPAFVAFNDDRDGAEAKAYAAREPASVQAAVQDDGAEDLTGFGRWMNTPDGFGWVPNVPPDWSPYANGQFVWEPSYGWTWISSDPWGWAPSHYGRWAQEDNIGWAWIPGAPAPWSPAQVAFVQTAAGIAWLPLAPGDPAPPSATSSARIPDLSRYRNARRRDAFVMTSLDRFRRGDFHHLDRVGYARIGHAAVLSGFRAVGPTRANLAFSTHALHGVARFPDNRRFAGHPVAFHRVPFDREPHGGEFAHRPDDRRPADVHPPRVGIGPQIHPNEIHPAPVHPGFGPRPPEHLTGGRPDDHPQAPIAHTPFGPASATTHTAFGPRPSTGHTTFGPTASVPHTTFGPSSTTHPSTAFGPSASHTTYGGTASTTYGPAHPTTYGSAHTTYGNTATSTTYGRASTNTGGVYRSTSTGNYSSSSMSRPAVSGTNYRPSQSSSTSRQSGATPAYRQPQATYRPPPPAYRPPAPSPTRRP